MQDNITEILKKIIAALVPIITKEIKDTYNKKQEYKNTNAFTLFKPSHPLQEENREADAKLTEEYKKNNRGSHKLGKKPSKRIDKETEAAYDAYKEAQKLLYTLRKDNEKEKEKEAKKPPPSPKK